MVNFKQIIFLMIIYSLFPLVSAATEGRERYLFSMFDNNVVIIDEIKPEFKQIPKLLLIGFALEQLNNKTLNLTDHLILPMDLPINPGFKPSFIFNEQTTLEDLLRMVIYFSAEDSSYILLYNFTKKYADFENMLQIYLSKLGLSRNFTPQELISLQVKLLTLYPYYSKLAFTDEINMAQISQKNPSLITDKPGMKIIITSKTYQEGSWFVTFVAKAQNWNIVGITQQFNEHINIDEVSAAITDKVENITSHYKSYKLFSKGQQLLLDHPLHDGQKVTINIPQDIIIIDRNELKIKKIKAKVLISSKSPEEMSTQLIVKLPGREMSFQLEIQR